MVWKRRDAGMDHVGVSCTLMGVGWSTRDVVECSEYEARGSKQAVISERVMEQAVVVEKEKAADKRKPGRPPKNDPSRSADYYKSGKDFSSEIGV
jgi:hypothetical protein